MNKKVSSTRASKQLKDLTILGQQTNDLGLCYSPKILESFLNKNPKSVAWTTFICTEFTSLCPQTGQPDFAKIFINYVADKVMVESKSLKLYLKSFRNHGDFHEDCIQTICDDLNDLMKPKYIEVIGEFTPRGGISIFPFVNASNSDKQFVQLKNERFTGYYPGKYSLPLSRLY